MSLKDTIEVGKLHCYFMKQWQKDISLYHCLFARSFTIKNNIFPDFDLNIMNHLEFIKIFNLDNENLSLNYKPSKSLSLIIQRSILKNVEFDFLVSNMSLLETILIDPCFRDIDFLSTWSICPNSKIIFTKNNENYKLLSQSFKKNTCTNKFFMLK